MFSKKSKFDLGELNVEESKRNDNESLDLEDDITIISGPRNKSLATRHLEYIAYALLYKPQQVKAIHHDYKLIVNIQNHSFNLSDILEGRPDFEQLYFTIQQLDFYCKRYSAPLPNCCCMSFIGPKKIELHPAEESALAKWTSSHYIKMQNLLWNAPEGSDWIYILLDICIASHGLSKPLTDIKHSPCELTRGESARQAKSRPCEVGKSTFYTEKGFTATAHNSFINFFCLFRPVTVNFRQEKSINPLGKPISQYSVTCIEQEVLFPPNTEVIYTNKGYQTHQGFKGVQWFKWNKEPRQYWEATPVRSINSSPTVYNHNMSLQELHQIEKEKIVMLLETIHRDLLDKKANNSHSWLRKVFFDTLDNDEEVECYSRAIAVIKKLRSSVQYNSQDEDGSISPHDFNIAIVEIKYLFYEYETIKEAQGVVYRDLKLLCATLKEIKRHLPAKGLEHCLNTGECLNLK